MGPHCNGRRDMGFVDCGSYMARATAMVEPSVSLKHSGNDSLML